MVHYFNFIQLHQLSYTLLTCSVDALWVNDLRCDREVERGRTGAVAFIIV